jgi:uncharacterized membrane protein YciS (DUF1049 family)
MSVRPPDVTVNSAAVSDGESQPLLAPLGALPNHLFRRLVSRLLLHHIADARPVWHLFRIFAGAAAVMAINKAAGCMDDLSAVFNFFLCVSAFSGSTLLAVREVLVGGLIGSFFGVLFCMLTHLVSEVPFYAYTWQTVWTVPLAMFSIFYLLSVLGAMGPDKLQLLSALTSAILLITTPFPYPPIATLGLGEWSILVESQVTRAISLTNGCAIAVVFRLIGKCYAMAEYRCKVWRRRRNGLSDDDTDLSKDPDPMHRALSAPSMSPREHKKRAANLAKLWHPPDM